MNRRFRHHERADDFGRELPEEAPRQQGLIGQVVELTTTKGFGFLVYNRDRYFFHRSSFVRPSDFDRLELGHYLTFQPSRGPKGLRAEHLELA